MSARVGKGLIGLHSARGIEWNRFRSIRMAIAVSRMEKGHISEGRWPLAEGNRMV